MQSAADPSESSGSGGKPSLASLMRRAVNQAKAEAAAQEAAQAAGQEPSGDRQPEAIAEGRSSGAEGQTKAASGGKKALAAMLKKAAQKMQEDEAKTEAESFRPSSTDPIAQAGPTTWDSTAAPSLDSAAELQQGTGPAVADQNQQAIASDIQDSEHVRLSPISSASSFDSTDVLLPAQSALKKPPERHQSLGQRLGSLMKGALPLSRQSSYMPLNGDDPQDSDRSSGLLPPVRRVLPRDASYIPEWLNQTLGLTPGDSSQNEERQFVEADSLFGDEGNSELPQWVEWSAITPPEEGNTQVTEVQHRPAPLALVDAPSMPSDLTPNALDVPTPKGQQLFEFWQQKAAATAPLPASQNASAVLPLMHARRHHSVKRTTPVQQAPGHMSGGSLPAANGTASWNGDVLHTPDAAMSQHQGPLMLQPQTHAAIANCQQTDLPVFAQPQEPSQRGLPDHEQPGTAPVEVLGGSLSSARGFMQPSSASTALLAELTAASQLVHQQSRQQAELLEGLEHALSQLSEHRLLIQNPQTRLIPPSDKHQLGMCPLEVHLCCGHTLCS